MIVARLTAISKKYVTWLCLDLVARYFNLMLWYKGYHNPYSGIRIATGIIDLLEVADKPYLAFITFTWLILAKNLKLLNV